ncbi:MAG TPA: branched-chain amino acid transaminase [Dehalococcoidia bacterium]|nr:branched-chain amino acid transaminase [Dehalococcoidia bacterium]
MGERYAYFQKQIVPLAEAKVSVMTHAFNYGTACFEGIRGNWNERRQQLFMFRVRDHYERLHRSCKILQIKLPYSVDELVDLTVKVVSAAGFHEDVYVRPIAYKSGEIVGVRLHDIPDDFLIFVTEFGAYLDFTRGIHCGTSSWRRVDDLGIPARAKITGIYVNSALAKSEAILSGFDEAIMLTHDGHVSEGSGENIFIVERGRLITPPPSDNILVGITAATVRQIAREELGIETTERQIDRSELYIADEIFLTGTAAHVSPVSMVDHRAIGTGEVGPITAKLQERYFAIACGDVDEYSSWLTPGLTRLVRS